MLGGIGALERWPLVVNAQGCRCGLAWLGIYAMAPGVGCLHVVGGFLDGGYFCISWYERHRGAEAAVQVSPGSSEMGLILDERIAFAIGAVLNGVPRSPRRRRA